MWPHGGPHSVITTEYKTVVRFFASLGFGVLFVNYRGSTGLGEENVRALLGRWDGSLTRRKLIVKSRVGDMDVADVHRARELCLERMPHLDPEKVPLKSIIRMEALKLPPGCSHGWLARRVPGDPPGRAAPWQLQGSCCKEPGHQHCQVCPCYVMNRVLGQARLPGKPFNRAAPM